MKARRHYSSEQQVVQFSRFFLDNTLALLQECYKNVERVNNNNNNNNNNKHVMTTPLKGLFSVMLKSPSLPVKNPNW